MKFKPRILRGFFMGSAIAKKNVPMAYKKAVAVSDV
jgi:hypothetical protein